MIKILNIKQEHLKTVEREFYLISSKILNKKIKNVEDIFKELFNSKKRSELFDALNMMISLQMLNYQFKTILQKKLKSNLLNWTYPQIRIDGDFAKKFSAPLHVDRWILDRKKKGFVVWIPINKKGSTLFLSKKNNLKKIKKNKYWGLEAKDNLKLDSMHVAYGKALIFDEKTIHKSNNFNNNRVTIQLRYEVANFKNFKRSVNQVIDNNVKNYWLKKF